ncbi:hypothetical protein [Mesorhizobium sp. KR2-14]|uniref:hypothetical protein n=1 Tax=Mesorhizobium sp. KR2-14 TaxID=3156610 RepID=UPI0032B3B4D0
MTEAARIPQDVIDKARAFDVMAIAVRYGFTGRSGGQHGEAIGPCPGCGGRDRFAVSTKKNLWSCRQGGGDPIGGDAVALIRHIENCSFPRAVEILTGDLSTVVPRADTAKTEADENVFREKERLRAFNIWREGRRFPDRGAVAAYLEARGLDIALARMCLRTPSVPPS